MLLNNYVRAAGLDVKSVAEHLGISYIEAAKILLEEIKCPEDKREKLKNFLIGNYTKCIEKMLD